MFKTLRSRWTRRGLAEQPAEWQAVPFEQAVDARRIPGFAETAAQVARVMTDGVPAGELPFPSTGPQGHRARMRGKLIERGAEALADYELLEMLLFFAQPKGDTKPLAKRAINQFGSFGAVLSAPSAALATVPGFGDHTVAAIRLVQAAAVRLAQSDVKSAPVLGNWDTLIAYLNAVQGRERIEQFRVLFLDSRNRLIADEAQARGTVNHTPVYPREIAKRALEVHAVSLILVHNHPSGDPAASMADVEMTREIVAALTPLEVGVHDHIIIGNGAWLSFRQQGLLPRR